ncbi:hypothetical protein GDO81_004579 [Engystomops pustulosus]|uniref:Transmembrane protein 254 n=1 Tax=Engystomops pustulosus TaxID=76066 RepID=A0AAV6ZYB3_ENGPU|nr:hypothetical protein GDO81_004579 [Engystomops pustulosus]
MAPAGSASFFRRAGVHWMALITLAMGFFTWTVFWPTLVPYEQLGPLGSLAQYMVKNHYSVLYNGYWIAWAIHAAEALYSFRLCSRSLFSQTNDDNSRAGTQSVHQVAACASNRCYPVNQYIQSHSFVTN